MLAKVWSAAIVGLDAIPIEVEVDIASSGLPGFTIVGLPDKAIEESRERVRAALKNSGADFPAKRITVNLAPADLPKEGPQYDLPIAIGILIATGQLQVSTTHSLFIGELSLDGKLRRCTGVLPQILMARERHIKECFLPEENVREATVISGVNIYPITSLHQLYFHLTNQKSIEPSQVQPPEMTPVKTYPHDIADIKGQEQAKRALEIAAAGGHNILFKGPPGAGKTLLARTFPSILPTMTFSEMIEITKIYSIAGLLDQDGIKQTRPFRAPHHTISHIGLIGGGTSPRPGEISLAHRGILFLDELPEFPRTVLEGLRQPLEDGFVTISRAKGRTTFPCKFMLIAALNPCPCGYLGDTTHTCSCSPLHILRYQKRISGPLLDRIDIHIDVPAVPVDKLTSSPQEQESSETIRARVQKARDRQLERFAGTPLTCNADMGSKEVGMHCRLSDPCIQLLKLSIENLHLSARSYNRVIKLARTIADLEGSEEIFEHHIAESLQYRQKQEFTL